MTGAVQKEPGSPVAVKTRVHRLKYPGTSLGIFAAAIAQYRLSEARFCHRATQQLVSFFSGSQVGSVGCPSALVDICHPPCVGSAL